MRAYGFITVHSGHSIIMIDPFCSVAIVTMFNIIINFSNEKYRLSPDFIKDLEFYKTSLFWVKIILKVQVCLNPS